jgi:iron complex outermembrane recepter protein
MRTRDLFQSCATVCLLTGAGTVALAADPDANTAPELSESHGLEEVVVTATKREERLSDVPISITALSGAQLEEKGITRPEDLANVVPGLTYTLSEAGGPVYTLRGIGVNSDSIDVSPAVSVYVDQIPLPYPRMTEGAALDLERVEVLKGPQGTLFGQNSTGGAINYVAAKPTREFAAGIDATYGRFSEMDLAGFVSGPINDTLRARLSFRSEHRDGWQSNYVPLNSAANNTNGVRDFNTARLLVDWTPNDDLKVEANFNGWVDRSDALARQFVEYAPLVPGGYPGSAQIPNLQALLAAYPPAPQSPTAAGFDPGVSLRSDDSFYQGAVRADYSFGPDLLLTSISSFSHLAVFAPNDGDGTIYPDNFVAIDGRVSSVTEELRLSGTPLGGRLKWLVGANYEHDSTENNFRVAIQGTNTGLGPLRFYRFDMLNSNSIDTGAVFGNLNYNLTDTLSWEGSVRGTVRDDAFTGCVRDVDGQAATAISFLSSSLTGTPQSIPAGQCTTLGDNFEPEPHISRSLNEKNLSYRTGLSWKVTPATMLYANVSKGYKGGVFETLPAIIASQYQPDKQESVLAYEAGVKTTLFDRALTIEAAGFYYDYTNKQLLGYVQTLFGLLNSLVSIPRAKVQGGELQASWRINNLRLSFGGTYLDTAVTSHYDLAGAFLGVVDVKGAQFPNTPKVQLNGDAEYRLRVSNALDGYLGASVLYHSSTPATFGGGPLFDLPDYALLDLRAGLQSDNGRWEVQLWGHNVTNKYYWNSVAHPEDTVTRSAGMPATYGVTLRTRF